MGSFRSTPDNIKHSFKTQDVNNGQLTFQVVHMCGWRIYMEDAHISKSPMTNKNHSIFGVFDGHGGPQVSTFVERHFVIELQKNANYLKATDQKPQDYQTALKQTFCKMDKILLESQGQKQLKQIQKQMRQKDNGPKYQQQSHAGCTANVVLITQKWVICANAGDSRSVARNNNGQSKQLSIDHKPQDPKQLDRIKKAGGTVSFGRVNGGLNLSRAIGDFQYKKNTKNPSEQMKPQDQMITPVPDFIRLQKKDIDFIIMGCDGIWQVKTNSQMVNWINKKMIDTTIKKQTLLRTILQQLLDELVSKDSGNQYGMDNMSAILIKFDKQKK